MTDKSKLEADMDAIGDMAAETFRKSLAAAPAPNGDVVERAEAVIVLALRKGSFVELHRSTARRIVADLVSEGLLSPSPNEQMVKALEAMRFLSEVHSREDEVTGIVVFPMARMDFHSEHEYVQAWRTIRAALSASKSLEPQNGRT